jgi:hypothetical protein
MLGAEELRMHMQFKCQLYESDWKNIILFYMLEKRQATHEMILDLRI